MTETTGDVVAHHVRCFKGWGGMGIKPSDYRTVPLTTIEHTTLHAEGETSYWTRRAVNVRFAIVAMMLMYLRDVCGLTTFECFAHIDDLSTDKGLETLEDEIIARTTRN